MAKGKWFTVAAKLDGVKVWRTARKRDAELFASEANLEYVGGWCADRKAVEDLRDYLNAKEGEP